MTRGNEKLNVEHGVAIKRDNPMLKWRVQQGRTHRFPRVLVHAKNKKTTSGCNERIIFLGCKTQKDN